MDSLFSGLSVADWIVGILVVAPLLFVMDLGVLAAARELRLLRRAKPLTLFADERGESEKRITPESKGAG